MSMRIWAPVIENNAYVLYAKDAPDPSATSVSIFGALCSKLVKPLIKNFWLMTMTRIVRSIWYNPIATWLPARKDGNGQFHIICPIDTYISGIRITTDEIRRFLNFGVSWSFSPSSSNPGVTLFRSPPCKDAPYPAVITAWITSDGAAVPSTFMEFVSRLTATDVTPGTSNTAFSTWALQAAQLMPVTENLSIKIHLIIPSGYMLFPVCASNNLIATDLSAYIIASASVSLQQARQWYCHLRFAHSPPHSFWCDLPEVLC